MFIAHLGRVTVHVPVEGLLPVVDELDRFAGVQRQHARVDLHRQVLTGTERAAHAGQGQTYLLLGQPQGRGDLALVHVQPLGGHVQVHTAVLGGDRHPRLRSQEGLVLHAHLVLGGHHGVGLGAQPLQGLLLTLLGGGHVHERARTDGLVAQPVAALVELGVLGQFALVVHERTVGIQGRPARVADRFQNLVVDLDALHRATGGLRMVGGHDRHRLTLVTHLVEGQHRLVLVLQAIALGPRHVLVGEHRLHPGHLQRRGDVDTVDAGVWVRAAQGRAPQHVLHPHVRRVRELAGDLQRAVRTARAGTHPVLGGAGQVRDGTGRRRHQRLTSWVRLRCAARPRS